MSNLAAGANPAGPDEVFHLGSVDGVQNTVTTPAHMDTATSQAVSGTSAYRGKKTSLRFLPDASCHFLWTSTAAGTIIIQISNLPNPSDLDDTGWLTLTLDVAITQPAGSASGDYVDLAGLPFRWVRPKYTNASGSGTMAAWVVGKGI